MNTTSRIPDRSRLAWWLLTLALLGTVGFVLYSYVGTFVLGVFLYYGTRPFFERVVDRIDSRGLAALATLAVVVVPTLLLLGYLGYLGLQEFQAANGLSGVRSMVQPYVQLPTVGNLQKTASGLVGGSSGSPLGSALTTALGTLGLLANGLVHLFLSLAVVFFLLRDGNRLEGWFRTQIGGEGTTVYGYATAVDHDLESVYFGNVLTVFVVTVLAVVVYNGLNTISPSGVSIPFPTLLAVLTGLATFVPIVVGKIVYVPVGLYLGLVASRSAPSALWFPVVFLAVCLVVLDLLPVMLLRPYLSGRDLHGGMMMFAYVLGTMFFGWSGLFLGPLLLVLVIELFRIVFSELVHGSDLSPHATAAESIGSDPDTGPSTADTG